MMGTVLEILAPVLSVLATALAPLVAAAIFRLFQKWGIEIEAQHRDALQSALRNAALVTVNKAVEKGIQSGMTSVELPIGPAIDYVTKSVPDAVKKFSLDKGRILELLQPHLADAMLKKTDR